MGFERTDSDRVVLRLESVERGLLLSLVEQLLIFVAPAQTPSEDPLAAMVGIEEEAMKPEDPALARLLPDAYLDDDEAAGDFRRFTERSLREMKLAHARSVEATLQRSGEKLVLSEDEALAWLGFLNDTRLALGTRIGITEDAHEELAALAEDDPRAGSFHVYDWLTYLQDSLVHSLMPGP
jgi:hypothetical protein